MSTIFRQVHPLHEPTNELRVKGVRLKTGVSGVLQWLQRLYVVSGRRESRVVSTGVTGEELLVERGTRTEYWRERVEVTEEENE